MKTKLGLLLCALLPLASAFGGSETIIRERAKELRNQNNVRQGVAPPTTAAPAPVSAPNANVAAAPAQSPAVARLQADLAAIQGGSAPTATQKQRLAQNLLAVAQGAKPSLETAGKWAEDVSAAFAEKPLSPTSRARFVQELDAVLNPTRYPQAKPDGIFADVQAIFQENGLKREKAAAISNHVKTLAAEARK